jgi:WD40 repeat protein
MSFCRLVSKSIAFFISLTALGNGSKREKLRFETRALQAYLDVPDKPDADFAIQADVKICGTCEWLEEREDFLEWRDVFEDPFGDLKDHNSRCYWVSAKPGTGKSVLAGHTVKHLEDSKLDCSYYFFHHGNKSSQVLSGLLRSLAYQMALSNSIMRQALLDLLADGIHLDKDDERSIWWKIFLNGIFKAEIHRPQYWVIDALDECINYTSLFPLLSKIESAFPLRVFITSRKIPEIKKQFNRLAHDVIVAEISIDDTNRDIALFLHSRIESLPVDTPREREELANKILLKSGGCFLWVRLVVQVLEKTYGNNKIQTVLEAMPAEMGSFYEQTVKVMSNTIIEKNIAQSILRWAVCSTRPLRAEELQAALQLDIGESVRSIKNSVEGLCGQLVYVDKNCTVQMVHQTARDFLLDNKSSEFRIEIGLEHERLALACLNFLCSDELKPPRNRRLLGARKLDPSIFCDYACTAFSDHIFGASSEADMILVGLDKFLHTNVLTWIELIARKRSLYYLTQTAKNLKGYLRRRAKYLPPLGGQVATVEAWATDLIRLVAKFGATMISDPTSIYFLIPPLCPQNSSVYTQFAKSSDGLVMAGVSNENWEDCVSCIDFNSSIATALACGENVFAIGMRSGAITLYNYTTFQVESVFQHMESVKCLKFDSSCKLFASCGWEHIKLWDRSGSQIWNQSLKTPCISIAFDTKYVVGVSKNSLVKFWDLKDGTLKSDRFYPYIKPDDKDGSTAPRAPLTAAFSPNLEILALGYRSFYVCLWDLQNRDFIGCCSRSNGTEEVGLAVRTALFNPNPDMNLLAVGYEDGYLAIFDPWSRELINVVEGVNAFSLASSPDGRSLATDDRHGMVQLWDFETLTLLYRIKPFDFEVRALAFSGDGLRLIDIRDSRSKIWEPAVLVRKAHEEDVSVSDAAALPAITVGQENLNERLNTTTLVSHPTLSVIFAGKSNGDVAVFDAVSGKEKAILYSHPAFITAIACSKNNILVSADAGAYVRVRKLSKTPAGVWHTESQILYAVHKQAIRQLLLSPEGDYVLISGAGSASVWSTKTGLLVGTSEFVATQQTMWKWFSTHAPHSELLLVVDNTIEKHSWSSFPSSLLPSPLRISYDEKLKSREIEIQDAILDARSHHLIIAFRKQYGNKPTTTLLISDFPKVLNPETTIVPNRLFAALGEKVKFFIGHAPKRMVFVDNESWLSSVDLTAAKCTQYARHYFVPHEFVLEKLENIMLTAVLTATGDVAFTKEGELAVMRNGMKFQNIIELA